MYFWAMGWEKLGMPETHSLLACFRQLEDPRIARSKRHALDDILIISVCALLCGAEGFVEMEEFGKAQHAWLPAGATRLEAWRVGPGGMPERLAIGERFALSVVIPATITFDPGDLYQLWLQSVNSKGVSGPGPMQSWVAV